MIIVRLHKALGKEETHGGKAYQRLQGLHGILVGSADALLHTNRYYVNLYSPTNARVSF